VVRAIAFSPRPSVQARVVSLRFPVKTTIALGVLGAIGYFAWSPIAKAIEERNKPRWRTVKVEKGDVKKTVSATGTVRATKSVQVGSFNSGPIIELHAEFNQEVKRDELLAKIDPRLFEANVARDRATLATRLAEVQRVEALLQQARNDERRAKELAKKNKDFIAQSEMDNVRFSRLSLEAQLVIAKAGIEQSKATLKNSQANLDYCEIRSPEDGMIIDRKVEPGQTLASSFQTPELFTVGVGMRDKMHIFADVDEAEIGLIRKAADNEQPVTFSVTAYPDKDFEGRIEEVRFASAETQNVVTYPVVVGCPNPDLELLPGMTADLSFQIEEAKDVIKVPKAALRFLPTDAAHVVEENHDLLGVGQDNDDDKEGSETKDETSSDDDVENDKDDDKKSDKRYVWVVEGEKLKAIEIKVGLSDSRHYQLLEGDIEKGTELVTGPKAPGEE